MEQVRQKRFCCLTPRAACTWIAVFFILYGLGSIVLHLEHVERYHGMAKGARHHSLMGCDLANGCGASRCILLAAQALGRFMTLGPGTVPTQEATCPVSAFYVQKGKTQKKNDGRIQTPYTVLGLSCRIDVTVGGERKLNAMGKTKRNNFCVILQNCLGFGIPFLHPVRL